MRIPSYNRLKNQTAIITGGSSGIGKAIAIQMGLEGAKIVVNFYSHPEKAREVMEEIIGSGGEAISFQADVGKEEEVKAMFAKTIETFGTVDILVNNAGIEDYALIDKMSLEQWQKVITTNLTGNFLCSREAIIEFKRKGIRENVSVAAGKIICISSVHQQIPWAGNANYAASKSGILMLMKTIAQEVAKEKIRINSIAPGAIKTPINKDEWQDPAAEKLLLEKIPFGRMGDPLDIARAAVWLASDESDYVTGTTLFVDGGMSLYPSFA